MIHIAFWVSSFFFSMLLLLISSSFHVFFFFFFSFYLCLHCALFAYGIESDSWEGRNRKREKDRTAVL